MDDKNMYSFSTIKATRIDMYGMKIAMVIIGYIKNKYSLNISDVIPAEKDIYLCSYNMNKNELDLWLQIDTNYKSGDFSDIKSIGVYDFISQYTTSDYNLYCHIFKILHELGHAHFNKYLYDLYSKTNTCYGNISDFCTVFDNILNIFIPAQVEMDEHIQYYLNPLESYANVFAYNHYYEIITLLRNMNIIE